MQQHRWAQEWDCKDRCKDRPDKDRARRQDRPDKDRAQDRHWKHGSKRSLLPLLLSKKARRNCPLDTGTSSCENNCNRSSGVIVFNYIDFMKPDCVIQSYCAVASLLFWSNNLHPNPYAKFYKTPLAYLGVWHPDRSKQHSWDGSLGWDHPTGAETLR